MTASGATTATNGAARRRPSGVRLERFRGARTDQLQLAHVAAIEHARAIARPQMFGHDPFILDRHMVARKFNHARAIGSMPSIQRQR